MAVLKYWDEASGQYLPLITPGATGSATVIADEPPVDPAVGLLWVDSDGEVAPGGDAVEAIEAELGLNPSGAAATVAARLAALDVTVAGTSEAAAAAVAAHAGAGDPHSQYATDSDLAAHVAASTAHIPAGAVALGQVGAVRWDETVGRRAFMWDTVNSRWQMVYGDTGARYVTDWFSNGWNLNYSTSGIRRYGNVVDMWIILNAANATARAALTLPLGFRPANLRYQNATGYLDPPGPINLTEIDTAGVLSVWGYTTTPPSGSYYISGTWTTNDPWPTVMPGTASGGIPSA